MGNDFVTVKIVNTNGEFIKNVQIERGVTFQNKGGIYTAGNGNNTITMTNYQLETFEAMADINKENGSLSTSTSTTTTYHFQDASRRLYQITFSVFFHSQNHGLLIAPHLQFKAGSEFKSP